MRDLFVLALSTFIAVACSGGVALPSDDAGTASGDARPIDATSPCTAGATERETCGRCGARRRVCAGDARWSDWSSCEGEAGACVPRETREETCAAGGVRTRVCDDACTWGEPGPCTSATRCTPGATEELACGECGKQVRVCQSDASWSSWSACAGSCGGDAGICRDVVDVVFVVDVSSSMDVVLESLGKQVGALTSVAAEIGPTPRFGFVGFADNHRFGLGGALGDGKVHVEAATLRAAFEDFAKTYTRENRNPGDGPSGRTMQNPLCEENALDALVAAAKDFPWRSNATRIVVVATDETFLERPDNYGDRDGDGKTDKTDYPREGDYPARATYAETIAALRQAKIRVLSFTQPKPPGPFERGHCGTPRRLAAAQIVEGWSAPYKGTSSVAKGDPIPKATGGRDADLGSIASAAILETFRTFVGDVHCKPY